MGWQNRIKETLSGRVPISALAGSLAACRPLDGLRDQFAGRQLEADLLVPEEPWLPLLTQGPLAATVAAADCALLIAQSFLDVPGSDQQGQTIDRVLYDQVSLLLGVVPPLLPLLATTMADPTQSLGVRLPLALGPHGGVLAGTPLDCSDQAIRGLLRALDRMQGRCGLAVADTLSRLSAASAPPWAAVTRDILTGQQAACTVRAEGLSAQGILFLGAGAGQQGREALSEGLWSVVEAYVVLTQVALHPRVLPGVPQAKPLTTPSLPGEREISVALHTRDHAQAVPAQISSPELHSVPSSGSLPHTIPPEQRRQEQSDQLDRPVAPAPLPTLPEIGGPPPVHRPLSGAKATHRDKAASLPQPQEMDLPVIGRPASSWRDAQQHAQDHLGPPAEDPVLPRIGRPGARTEDLPVVARPADDDLPALPQIGE